MRRARGSIGLEVALGVVLATAWGCQGRAPAKPPTNLVDGGAADGAPEAGVDATPPDRPSDGTGDEAALDAPIEAIDAIDVPDATDATDAPDATDDARSDLRDAHDARDAVDAGDADEAGDAVDAGGDAEGTEAGCPDDGFTCDTPPSCRDHGLGLAQCGPEGESCCASLPVPPGLFYRSYDGVSCPGGPTPDLLPALGCYKTKTDRALVNGFRLDKYLVTVARFRRFLDAVLAGWTPAAGAGRHEHLNGGQGLADLGAPGRFEAGWDSAWNVALPHTLEQWQQLGISEPWLQPPAGREDFPAGSLDWGKAYAFCIWDGGFLPSEAEWNYAAAGGDEQRVYPWSQPPTSTSIDCTRVVSAFTDVGLCAPNAQPISVGGKSPAGDGRWGHTDLVGHMDQWLLDWLGNYVTPSIDGAQLEVPPLSQVSTGEPMRALRGVTQNGNGGVAFFIVSGRTGDFPLTAFSSASGVRCARAPLPGTP